MHEIKENCKLKRFYVKYLTNLSIIWCIYILKKYTLILSHIYLYSENFVSLNYLGCKQWKLMTYKIWGCWLQIQYQILKIWALNFPFRANLGQKLKVPYFPWKLVCNLIWGCCFQIQYYIFKILILNYTFGPTLGQKLKLPKFPWYQNKFEDTDFNFNTIF